MTNIYTQTTADTCLPSCLMMALEKKGLAKPSQELELGILVEGDKFSKFNRTFGHLSYVVNKFGVRAYYYSSSLHFIKTARDLAKKIDTRRITIDKKAINSRMTQELLNDGIVLVMIEDFALRKDCHFPHVVLIDSFARDRFTILDSWQGKRFFLTPKDLDNALLMLDKLLFPRELIVIK